MVMAERASPLSRHQAYMAYVREELSHLPNEDGAPLKLSEGDGSILGAPIVRWLDSRAAGRREFRAYLDGACDEMDYLKRRRAVRATWLTLVEGWPQQKAAERLGVDRSTIARDVERVVGYLAYRRERIYNVRPATEDRSVAAPTDA